MQNSTVRELTSQAAPHCLHETLYIFWVVNNLQAFYVRVALFFIIQIYVLAEKVLKKVLQMLTLSVINRRET